MSCFNNGLYIYKVVQRYEANLKGLFEFVCQLLAGLSAVHDNESLPLHPDAKDSWEHKHRI